VAHTFWVYGYVCTIMNKKCKILLIKKSFYGYNIIMKRFFLFLSIVLILIIYVYVLSLDSIPNNIIKFENEELNIKTLFGIAYEEINKSANQDKIGKVIKSENIGEKDEIIEADSLDNEEVKIWSNKDSVVASSNLNKNTVSEKSTLVFKLFDKITLKEVDVDVISNVKVVPVGSTIGLKLYTKGVLVVGMNEVETSGNVTKKPYENTGIVEGDMIISINNTAITCTADLLEEVSKSNGEELQVEYVRDGTVYETGIKPEKVEENQYKLGLWVRDSAAGVGTITYYEPSTGRFAALGHGIMDVDTGELLEIANGEIVTANILSINKGEKGTPGEIRGSILNQNTVGQISKNTEIGIYGTLTNAGNLNIDLTQEKALEIAKRSEIQIGSAKIICTLENNKTEEYDIEIQKIDINNNENNKSMVIKVTDKELLEKTNGIIQGMSGSPIIQNGKLIGAVTQVFVSSPDMGYGVFADLMIKEMKTVN